MQTYNENEKRILNLKNNINLEAREMAQNLGIIAALLEAPRSIPSMHAHSSLQPSSTPVPRAPGVHMVKISIT